MANEKMEKCVWVSAAWLCALGLIVGMTGPAEANLQWTGTLSASAQANDPPAGASNPADLNSNFQMSPGANTVNKLPADGSWHKATSVLIQGTEAGAKSKAGLETESGKDKVVVKADSYVKDPRDGDLTNNGDDNSGTGSASATMQGYLLVEFTGSGTGLTVVDATLHTDLFLATQASPATGWSASGDTGVGFPVGVPFTMTFRDTSTSKWPKPQVQPNVGLESEVYQDSTLVAYGTAGQDQSGVPTQSGSLAGLTFVPWTAPGPDGQWYAEDGMDGFYGGIVQTLSLPQDYEFVLVPEPASMLFLGLGGLAGVLRRRRP